jgi:Ni/Co efflux regulator RcnB
VALAKEFIMKKFIIAALGATLISGPALAQSYGHYDGRGDRGRGQQVRVIEKSKQVRTVSARKWHRGERFDRRYARNYREISNPRSYRLRDAPRGYHWVRSGNDAVMVSIAGGLIAAVLANAF